MIWKTMVQAKDLDRVILHFNKDRTLPITLFTIPQDDPARNTHRSWRKWVYASITGKTRSCYFHIMPK